MESTQLQTNPMINTKLSQKRLLSVKDIKMEKLKIRFDIQMLNMIIAFLIKDSVLRTRKTIHNIRKVFDAIDDSMYEGNVELESRIWIIRRIIDCILSEQFESTEYIQMYCKDRATDEYTRELIDELPKFQIKYAESKYLVKKIDSTLEFGYIATVRDAMMQILNTIDLTDYLSYASVSEDIYRIATAIINIKRESKSIGADQTFSLNPEVFESVVTDAVTKLKDRNRIFRTGIQRLNTILAPGYLSKRLYTYLAFPGKGKSTILLKAALDIRKYNSDIKTKNPDKRPAVLMLTLENDIAETVERIYNMSVDSDDIRNYRPKQVIKSMQEAGHLKLCDDNNIDIIIKEYKNREISTEDIYTIINDLSDEGVEVITLIVDYMKRIRPAEPADSEKTELKNITNELKELAKFFDIPCITAQQLNRNGAAVIDAALQANKEDVTRLVGRDAVAGAWEINTMVSPCGDARKNNLSNGGNFLEWRPNTVCA